MEQELKSFGIKFVKALFFACEHRMDLQFADYDFYVKKLPVKKWLPAIWINRGTAPNFPHHSIVLRWYNFWFGVINITNKTEPLPPYQTFYPTTDISLWGVPAKLDKESITELQRTDANCNDCKHMIRNMDLFKQSVEKHQKWQLDYFEGIQNKLFKKANEHKEKGDLKLFETLTKEAKAMKFQFDKKQCLINYGRCSKFDKDVSFIPNTLQLETQECFEHRR